MQRLKASEAAYIAALIDADDTVTLIRRHRNEARHAVVTISNTDQQLLKFVRSLIGAGKITNKSVKSLRHRQSSTYAITNRQAVHLLAFVEPFLKTCKAARARMIIDRYIALTPRNGHYMTASAHARKQFEARVLAIKPR